MIRKKIAALSAAALMAFNAIPASAYYYGNIDVSNPEKVINVRVNKPYLNFTVKAGDGVDLSGMKFMLKDTKGNVAAKFRSGDKRLTVTDNHAFDFSTYRSAEDTKSLSGGYDVYKDAYDLFTPDPVKGAEPTGMMYNAAGTRFVNGDKYYIRFADEYYYYYIDKKKLNVVDTVTVPAKTILVDVDSRYSTNNDKTTYFWLEPISSSDLVSDLPEGKSLKMYSVAGKTLKYNAEPGTYHVRVNGGRAGGSTCQAYDHPTKYLKVKIPFNDAFPGLCNSDLTIDKEFFGNIYHYDLRGEQTSNVFSALYYSGATISAPIPDANGDVAFWVNEDDLKAYMEYDYSFRNGGGGGSVRQAQFPRTLEKINSIFEFPKSGYCIYNIQPANYDLVFDDRILARDYTISGNTVKVTDTKTMQKATFTVNKKPLLLGDCNRDGTINVTDIAIIAAHVKAVKKLDGRGPLTADVDESSIINITDVSTISAHVKGKKLIHEKWI